jgi:hypothetical protein
VLLDFFAPVLGDGGIKDLPSILADRNTKEFSPVLRVVALKQFQFVKICTTPGNGLQVGSLNTEGWAGTFELPRDSAKVPNGLSFDFPLVSVFCLGVRELTFRHHREEMWKPWAVQH